MTATTPNLGLRYPTATDKPCDGWQQIRDLRNDIYNVMDGYLTDMQRQRALPMVVVTYSGPLGFSQFIPWTTVEQDDIEAADLILQRNAIFLGKDNHPDRIGTYIYGLSVTYFEEDCQLVDVILTPNTYDARAYDFSGAFGFSTDPDYPPWVGNSALLKVSTETMVQARSVCFSANAFARMWAVRIGEP